MTTDTTPNAESALPIFRCFYDEPTLQQDCTRTTVGMPLCTCVMVNRDRSRFGPHQLPAETTHCSLDACYAGSLA
jgi:hypothetical protein